ncbi:hypothetical protein LOC67_25710 [Stieleria sp. JC731]|uniref:hypothetical protein n=1 Tax=Pirellulaceae TaxID=2691357 RepID=UPI001E49B304|nr:hypothetical protein [Stieleria sp. JC731]MCC9603963.1 hypothetical protein [Stieleria sp. JC731]
MQSLRHNATFHVARSEPCPIKITGCDRIFRQLCTFIVFGLAGSLAILPARRVVAAGGSLILNLEDETSHDPVISRVEFFRVTPGKRDKTVPIRQTVSAGIGVVVDRSVVLELPDSAYRFEIVRGPEYRTVGGNFTLEKTSLDEKTVSLPRMINMKDEGWLSGDCCVVPSSESLPLRMASEDLHVAAVLGDEPAKPIPRRDRDEPIEHDPAWIRSDVTAHQGLIFYKTDDELTAKIENCESSIEALVAVANDDDANPDEVKVAIENPFAWELPIWLASGRVRGVFVLGDWLRLDKTIYQVREGRNEQAFSLREPTQVGRFAERIYRHMLDAGIEAVPLAGGGDESAKHPVGYNRLYVSVPNEYGPKIPTTPEQWWSQVWNGCSVATNGPLLRPRLAGELPGHVFESRRGEVLQLFPELNLTVRDPVDYLEVIHNNRVHYSARLDEFAKAGGKIPPIEAQESGWVIMRVLTLYEGHYRAAVTAPWWIEYDGQRRVSDESVDFFREWLSAYEKRLTATRPNDIEKEAPFVRAARRFWEQKAGNVNSQSLP